MQQQQQHDAEAHKTMFLDRLSKAKCEELMKVGELRSYAAGTVLHSQGERLPGVLVVSKGCLKLVRSTKTDKMQVLHMAAPGRCMGDVSMLTGLPAAASAIAVEDTECWFIPASAMLPFFKSDPEVSAAFLWHMADRMRHLVALVETLSLHTVPERVAKLILDFHEEEPGKNFVEFRDTQEGMAHHIGSSREAFNRGLKMLNDLGFVHNSYPVVHITDEAKLRRFSEGC
jgi:CRP/FNR family transcriptional regulator